jgi:hypothetical protein
VASVPAQSLSVGFAEAVQELAFVLDQFSITCCPRATVPVAAVIVTVGIEGGGEPEPPPQAFRRKEHGMTRNSATHQEDFLT